MEQIDVERSQEFRKCIECFLCQDTCHVIRDHEENKKSFAGPRFFIRIAELDMHPLDKLRNRKRTAQEEHGLGFCFGFFAAIVLVPEPGTLTLVALGLLGLVCIRRWRKVLPTATSLQENYGMRCLTPIDA